MAYDMRISDWSSDVCSSDLSTALLFTAAVGLLWCGSRIQLRTDSGFSRAVPPLSMEAHICAGAKGRQDHEMGASEPSELAHGINGRDCGDDDVGGAGRRARAPELYDPIGDRTSVV